MTPFPRNPSPTHDPITGVILAGGRSRRMGGREKAFLTLAGRTLLEHAVERLRPQVDALFINANGPPARFASWGGTVIPDLRPDHQGPLAGIEAALTAAPTPWVLTVPVDTPFLPPDLLVRLAALRRPPPRPVVAVFGGRLHPVCCLWPREALPAIGEALDRGARRLGHWFEHHPHHRLDFAPAEGAVPDPFFNVNTPSALAVARDLQGDG